MQHLLDFTARRVAIDATLIASHIPLPGLGVLPCNASVIHAREPVLVDTGTATARASFLAALTGTIDPADLRWIWMTHMDPDHTGNLAEVLALAPNARVVTSFLGAGKMGLMQLPLDRVHLLEPGKALDVGDRQLVALRPPVFDAPETMGLFDGRSRVLYSADCFGALLAEPASAAEDIGSDQLHAGQVRWAGLDAPWLALADRTRLAGACAEVQRLVPSHVVGSHLPPARGETLHRLADNLLAAHAALPVPGTAPTTAEAAVLAEAA